LAWRCWQVAVKRAIRPKRKQHQQQRSLTIKQRYQVKKPWSSENFNNSPDNFQFAVIGDRTGGADPKGVFVRAMDQLNLLQPEFVINVGDLVEGYANDKAAGNAMWDEIAPMINKLEMPFFYVGGNHDLGNDTMTQVWRDRFGATYYYFVYRNVLFLVMNSEDPSNPVPEDIAEKTAEYKKLQKEDPAKAQALLGEFMESLDMYKKPMVMSDQQINYFKKVLADHPDVRWTFVFLHQPDWDNPGDHKALKAIEAATGQAVYVCRGTPALNWS
jgi:3',5'-cyclic AMP phosphodiesterase CpdA